MSGAPTVVISIGELERIEQAMTPVPWEWDRFLGNDMDLLGPPRTEDLGFGPEPVRERIIETDAGHYGPSQPDRVGIEAMRNAMPALLAIARAAEAYASAMRWPEQRPASGEFRDLLDALAKVST